MFIRIQINFFSFVLNGPNGIVPKTLFTTLYDCVSALTGKKWIRRKKTLYKMNLIPLGRSLIKIIKKVLGINLKEHLHIAFSIKIFAHSGQNKMFCLCLSTRVNFFPPMRSAKFFQNNSWIKKIRKEKNLLDYSFLLSFSIFHS